MRIIILFIVILLEGCASTEVTSFTDPGFKNQNYQSFVVVTPNLNLSYSKLLQTKVCKVIRERGPDCSRAIDIFPPTRTYKAEQVNQILAKRGIEGYLALFYGRGSSGSQVVGTLSYGSASVFSNTVTAYGSTTPIRSFSRSDGYSIVLIDVDSARKAWVGGAKTHAQGLANITDEVFTSSLSRKLAEKLESAGLI